jgi:Zn finger protein HypA/HybF involved in hydrogenase expression
MHESSLIQNMLKVVKQVQEEQGSKPVRGITVELPEFGGMDEAHFRFHFDAAIQGTAWQDMGLEIKKVPYGIDAKLVSVTLGA